MNTSPELAHLDKLYRSLQDYAKAIGCEQLLAKAVVCSANNQADGSDEERYLLARRAIALQCKFHQEISDLKPEAVWWALLDENPVTA